MDVAKHMHDINQEALRQTNQSYEIQSVIQYLKTIKTKQLCFSAVENFIGSKTSPRNQKTTNLLFQVAFQNAKQDKEILDIQFYQKYLQRLESMNKNDQIQYNKISDEILGLCEKGHGISQHIIAKELFEIGHEQKNNQILLQSLEFFQKACQNNSLHSFYYIGILAEEGQIIEQDFFYAYQCFLIAATQDSAYAYYKLSQYNKIGQGTQQNNELFIYYTKKAAELGLLHAQHNLGCIYLEGSLEQKNEVKALAWFIQAGKNGYVHSFFNAANMLMNGSDKIQKNLQLSLQIFQKIKESKQIDVDDQIKQIQSQLD